MRDSLLLISGIAIIIIGINRTIVEYFYEPETWGIYFSLFIIGSVFIYLSGKPIRNIKLRSKKR